MNVKQLMDILKDKDPNLTVLMSTDEEGNAFNNLDAVARSTGDIEALVLFPDSALVDTAEVFA